MFSAKLERQKKFHRFAITAAAALFGLNFKAEIGFWADSLSAGHSRQVADFYQT